jgi:wyosine [tRNA(Phe)-imidazoG37] synthetase (radical SAM superfamily)
VGRTTDRTIKRSAFGSIGEILDEVKRRLDSDSLPPDYIGISGSGEPTLNSDIGEVIAGIKRMTSVPVAVLTNGSLLWMDAVQEALVAADLVLPSLDAWDTGSFEYVNRPHPLLCFEEMVDGIASFAKRYQGRVWLEVLLLAGVTGTPAAAKKIASLARRIHPERVQLNTVCRPPAEQSALALSESDMLALKPLFSGKVDIISGVDRSSAYADGLAETHADDILTLLQRRPCTAKDVVDGLGVHMNQVLKELDNLLKAGKVTTDRVGSRVFYSAGGSV